MKSDQWPYIPDHITNDGNNSENPELCKLKGVGIIPNRRLKGFQTYISEMLENPTTIVEFSPNGEMVRTDSSVLPYTLHEPCRKLREATESKFCLDCDNWHAKLFQYLTKPSLKNELNSRLEKCEPYLEGLNCNNKLNYHILTSYDRMALEYDCPLLGYRENIFPVFFEEKVIATFFVGEIILADRLKDIPKHQENFFEYHTELDSGIYKEVIFAHKERIKNNEIVLSKESYEDLLKKACHYLSEFEKELADTMHRVRSDYVKEKTENHLKTFQQSLLSADIDKTDIDDLFILLWENLSGRLQKIVEDFYLKFILIFWKEKNGKHDNTPLGVIAKGIYPGLEDEIPYNEINFDISKLKNSSNQDMSTLKERDFFSGLNNLPENLSKKNCKVRYLSVPFHPSGSLVMFTGYFQDSPLISIKNDARSMIDESAENFLTVVRSVLSSLLAARESFRMEMALRVFGHDVSQLTVGIDGLRFNYLSSLDVLKNIEEKKIVDINKDLQGFLKLIFLLSKQANYSVDVGQPRNELRPYGDLLFKWKDIYRLEEEKKNLQIYIPNPPNEYQEIFADLRLMEQLLYNLVNNAVKYCYSGTKIILDCKKFWIQEISYFEISVTNFGIKVDDQIQDYKPYQRGENAKIVNDGLGIGLYLANKIAVLHGGKLTHSSKNISEFNVPLMQSYVDNRAFDLKKRELIRDDLERLKKEKIYNSIVALNKNDELRYNNPKFFTLKEKINQRTYKVVFKITIPENKELI